MSNIKKVLNYKIIILLIAFTFSFEGVLYPISDMANLRIPIDIGHTRLDNALKAVESPALVQLYNELHSLIPDSPGLEQAIKKMLAEQDRKTAQSSFLPPDATHICRVVSNTEAWFSLNPVISGKMAEIYGGSHEKALKAAKLGAILSKIGFSHPDMSPSDRATYQLNRLFAMELLKPLEADIKTALSLTDEQYLYLAEAILREGTFGIGTEGHIDDFSTALEGSAKTRKWADKGIDVPVMRSEDKYKNPLTALLTLASEMDIAYPRLADWQQKEALIKALIEIVSDPVVTQCYVTRTYLEIKRRKAAGRRQAALQSGNNDEADKARREFEDINEQIGFHREGFNNALKSAIKREIFDKRDVFIKRLMNLDGLSAAEARQFYKKISNFIIEINSESYLWYLGSFSVDKASIVNGETLVLRKRYLSPMLGAAANLSRSKKFHLDRLLGVTAQINDTLGTNIQIVEKAEEGPRREIYEFVKGKAKANRHVHLAMAAKFIESWNNLLEIDPDNFNEQDPLLANSNREAINRAEDLLRFLYIKRLERELGRRLTPEEAQDINNTKLLGPIFEAARRTAYAIFTFNKEHEDLLTHRINGNGYQYPKHRDYLVEDAEEILAALAKPRYKNRKLSYQKQVIIKKQIELYYELQRYLRHWFNFQEGSLVDFVEHFMATANAFSKGTVRPEEKEYWAYKRTVWQGLDECVETNIWQTEYRFNIGPNLLREVLIAIQAYKEWIARQPAGALIPDMRLILSVTKSNNPEQAVEGPKTNSAMLLVNMLDEAKDMARQGKRYDPSMYLRNNGGGDQGVNLGDEYTVTPQDVLKYVAGCDAAGQEEGNPPRQFFKAFDIFNNYNERELKDARAENRPPRLLGMTFHVSESGTDASVETKIRHGFEAMFGMEFERLRIDDKWRIINKPVMNRLGHLIFPALADYEQFKGTTRVESIDERIQQIQFDLALLKIGFPLLAVTEESLNTELETLLVLQENIRIRQAAGEVVSDAEQRVSYTYDTEEKIIDLRSRARFMLDAVIAKGVVVETNPTSNREISPHIRTFKMHPLRTYNIYKYGDWAFDEELLRRMSKGQLEILKDYQRESKEGDYAGKKVRTIIGDDDPAIFGTTLPEEYSRAVEPIEDSLGKKLGVEEAKELLNRLRIEALHDPIRKEPSCLLLEWYQDEGLAVPGNGLPLPSSEMQLTAAQKAVIIDRFGDALVPALEARGVDYITFEKYIGAVKARDMNVIRSGEYWEVQEIIRRVIEDIFGGDLAKAIECLPRDKFTDFLEGLRERLSGITYTHRLKKGSSFAYHYNGYNGTVMIKLGDGIELKLKSNPDGSFVLRGAGDTVAKVIRRGSGDIYIGEPVMQNDAGTFYPIMNRTMIKPPAVIKLSEDGWLEIKDLDSLNGIEVMIPAPSLNISVDRDIVFKNLAILRSDWLHGQASLAPADGSMEVRIEIDRNGRIIQDAKQLAEKGYWQAVLGVNREGRLYVKAIFWHIIKNGIHKTEEIKYGVPRNLSEALKGYSQGTASAFLERAKGNVSARERMRAHTALQAHAGLDPRSVQAMDIALNIIVADPEKRAEIKYHNESHFNELFGFFDDVLAYKKININDPWLVWLAILFHDLGYFEGNAKGHEDRSKAIIGRYQGALGLSDAEIKAIQYIIDKTKLKLVFENNRKGDDFGEESRRESNVYLELIKAEKAEGAVEFSEYAEHFIKEFFGDTIDLTKSADRKLVMDAMWGGRIAAAADIYGHGEDYLYSIALLHQEFVREGSPAAAPTRFEQIGNSPFFLDQIAVNKRLKWILGEEIGAEGMFRPFVGYKSGKDPLAVDDMIPPGIKEKRRLNIEAMKKIKRCVSAIKTGSDIDKNIEELLAFVEEGTKRGVFDAEAVNALHKEIEKFLEEGLSSQNPLASAALPAKPIQGAVNASL